METPNIHILDRIAWGYRNPWFLNMDDLRMHLHVLGSTGSGKTTLLGNLVNSLIHNESGVGIIDPHGDFSAELLEQIPPTRLQDVVYFDAADKEASIALNPLASARKRPPHLVAAGLVSAFKAIWSDSWGPRLEYILFNTLASLAHCQNVSLLSVPRMLSDESYREWVLRQVDDPVLHEFWVKEYEGYDPGFRREAISPIQNKIGQYLAHPLVRNIIGQVSNRVNAAELMDRGAILIVNLSKGEIGEAGARLLGALIVSEFYTAALERSGTPEDERRDFTLVIDEFQNFLSDTAAALLSEARKFRLSLVLAHQYMDQLSDRVADSVIGNTGTTIAFKMGATDAEFLSKAYGGDFLPHQFTEQSPYQVLVRPTLKGGFPFRGITLPPQSTHYGFAKRIRTASRQRFTTKRSMVEDRIKRWLKNAKYR